MTNRYIRPTEPLGWFVGLVSGSWLVGLCLAVGPGILDFHRRHGRLDLEEKDDLEMNLCTFFLEKLFAQVRETHKVSGFTALAPHNK